MEECHETKDYKVTLRNKGYALATNSKTDIGKTSALASPSKGQSNSSHAGLPQPSIDAWLYNAQTAASKV